MLLPSASSWREKKTNERQDLARFLILLIYLAEAIDNEKSSHQLA